MERRDEERRRRSSGETGGLTDRKGKENGRPRETERKVKYGE